MEKRKIPYGTRAMTGKMISLKNKESISYESRLEKDFYTLLEFDKSVKGYTEQLIKVEYVDENNRKRRYTPDVLIDFHKGKSWLCEVKFKADLRENFSEYKGKFKAAKNLCSDNGWEFKLITEEYIRNDYLENAKFLLRFRKFEPNYKEEQKVVKFILDRYRGLFFSPATIRNDIALTWESKAIMMSHFWRLVYCDHICFDMSEKLTMNTEMWLNDTYYGE